MKNRLPLTLLLFCSLLISTQSLAQDSVKTGIKDRIILKGLFNNTDIGILVGSSKNNLKSPFSFMSVTGYHITKQFAAGIGLGVDFLDETYMPLVVDLRYYFRKSDFSPFIFLQSGYSISTGGDVDAASNPIFWNLFPIWIRGYPPSVKPKGGFLINPGFGIRKMFSKNFGLTFSVSYRYQRLNYEAEDDIRLELEYNRMNFRVGIIFK